MLLFQAFVVFFVSLKGVHGDVLQKDFPSELSTKREETDDVITELCGLTKEGEKDLEDKKQAKALDRYPQEENDKLFEGDIVLTEKQKEKLKLIKKERGKGGKASPKEVITAILSKRWPIGQPIPYFLDASLETSAKVAITSAINHIQQFTCVEFKNLKEKPNNLNMIVFHKDVGCYSSLGMMKSRVPNIISIGNRCDVRGIVVHEIMHAFGFMHENARLDRDEYITLEFENFRDTDAEKDFDLGYEMEWGSLYSGTSYGIHYDFNSIMHYGLFTGSIDITKPTITLKEKWRKQCNSEKTKCNIGQRHGLSESDAKQINMLFECPKKSSKKSSCPQYHDPKDFIMNSWPQKSLED